MSRTWMGGVRSGEINNRETMSNLYYYLALVLALVCT